MNSQPGGFFTAMLMLVPLVGVPAAAIIGIPALPGPNTAVAGDLAIMDDLQGIEPSELVSTTGRANAWDPLDDLLSPVPSKPVITHQPSVKAAASQAPESQDPFGHVDGRSGLYSPFAEITPADDFSNANSMTLASAASAVSTDDIRLTSFEDLDDETPVWDYEPSSTTAQASVAATHTASAANGTRTWEQAVGHLNALGVRNYRLEEDKVRGGYHFYCVFSPPQQPNVRHRFDATATRPLDAVTDVLNQIERWRSIR